MLASCRSHQSLWMHVMAGVPGRGMGAVSHLTTPTWACLCCSLSSLYHTDVIRLLVALCLSVQLIPEGKAPRLSCVLRDSPPSHSQSQTWRMNQSRSPLKRGPELLGFVQCPVPSSCLPATFCGELYGIISPNG